MGVHSFTATATIPPNSEYVIKSDILLSVDAEGHEHCSSSAASGEPPKRRSYHIVPPLAEFIHVRMPAIRFFPWYASPITCFLSPFRGRVLEVL